MTRLRADLKGRLGAFSLDVGLDFEATGVTAVFGRSGSGKTTLLRALAGLDRMAGGVRFGDAIWQEGPRFLPTERRGVGYVFQEAALLPHLRVRGNLDYAAHRARRRQGTVIGFDAAVVALGLENLLDRTSDGLSGGERQRVAIARALLSQPLLALMDEPLASLDLAARSLILGELDHLRRKIDLPILYVTHAVDEVARLADRMVWLDDGRVRAEGAPGEVLSRLDLGDRLASEASGLIQAVVRGHDTAYQLTELESAWGMLLVRRLDLAPGGSVRLRIRASDVSLGLGPEGRSSILNVLPGTIEQLHASERGDVLVRLRCSRAEAPPLLARITRKSADRLSLRPGLEVTLRIKSVNVR